MRDKRAGQDSADEMALFIHAVLDDEPMTRWVLGLESLVPTERKAAIASMLQRMQAAHDTPKMQRVVQALSHRQILHAVTQTIRDTLAE